MRIGWFNAVEKRSKTTKNSNKLNFNMLRGHRSIYQSLFPENATENITPSVERRGRSEMLICKRNELLLCRYYYYVKIERKNYFDALDLLEQELFLCKRTMQNILYDNEGILKELLTKKPDTKYFKNKFTHMMW